MRSVLCFVVAAIVGGPGPGLAQPFGISSDFAFDSVAPPVAARWQLATDGGTTVDLPITLPASSPGGFQIAHIVTPANASTYGVDLAAWRAAVNDPAFTRSIFTWGGLTKEVPIGARTKHIELDDLRVFFDGYRWPVPGGTSPLVFVQTHALDFPAVPEPAAWLLAIAGPAATWFSTRPRSRCRRYKSRCGFRS